MAGSVVSRKSAVIAGEVSCFQNPTSLKKTLSFALAIILGLGYLGIGFVNLGIKQSWWHLPAFHSFKLVYPIILMGTGVGILIIAAKFFACNGKSPSEKSKGTLLIKSETLPYDLSYQIHKLCEKDTYGANLSTSPQEVRKIIEDLKGKDALYALNSIPSCFDKKMNPFIFKMPPCILYPTPLCYWSYFKPNIEIVKLLVANGAAIYVEDESFIRSQSALFVAALKGQLNLVSYLLNHKAKADIAFNENPLRFFLPLLVYYLPLVMESANPPKDPHACLKRILTDLSRENPKNLQMQLQIPVSCKLNCVGWLKKFATEHPAIAIQCNHLIQILVAFGADEKKILSYQEIKKSYPHLSLFRTIDEEHF